MNNDKQFTITSICKDDLLSIFKSKKAIDRINAMTDDEMRYLASKLADDYCEQLFWTSLRAVFENRFLDKA